MTEPRKITMDDLTIQAWPLDKLKPAPDNHKKHSKESTARLAKSLADIGQIQPCVVDKNCEIIAGHGRLLAAQSLGWEKIKVIQIPVDRATAIKARIADNLMSNQDIDQEKLTRELNELFQLDSEIDMESLMIDDGLAKIEEINLDTNFRMDDGALMEDTNKEVGEFTENAEQDMAAAEDADTPLRTIFGFTKTTGRQARVLKDFMAMVMEETGHADPADALTVWVEEVME